jgi:serine/threonine protein kinase
MYEGHRVYLVSFHDYNKLLDFAQNVHETRLLTHPNLTQVYGIFENPLQSASGRKRFGSSQVPNCAVYELIEESLWNILKRKDLEIGFPIALYIAQSVASGLQFLHTREPPFIHRNVISYHVGVNREGL